MLGLRQRSCIESVCLVVCGIVSASLGDFTSTVSVVVEPHACTEHLLAGLVDQAGYRLAVVNPSLLPKECGFYARFHGCEVRYPVSWALHFANASATVSNGTLRVSASKSSSARPDDLLRAWREKLGPRAQRIEEGLQADMTLVLRDASFIQTVDFLCTKCGLEVIIIHPLLARDDPRVDVDAHEEAIETILANVLEQGNATFRYQGGGIFIYPKGKRRGERGVGPANNK